MEDAGKDPAETPLVLDTQFPPAGLPDCVKRSSKTVASSVTRSSKLPGQGGSSRKRAEPKSGSDSSSRVLKPTGAVPSPSSNLVSFSRRNSTGGFPEKGVVVPATGKHGARSAATRNASVVDPVRRSLPEIRKNLSPAVVAKPVVRSSASEIRRPVPISPVGQILRLPPGSDAAMGDSIRKSSIKTASPDSYSKRGSSPSLKSSGSSGLRKSVSKFYSPSSSTRSVNSRSKAGLSPSIDRSSSVSGSRKITVSDSLNSRFIVLPQVDIKAGDDVRLDLRGHKVRSLNAGGLNLTSNLEFVYLRDNLLSSLGGVEILKQVKVLDLSFNDFKGPGFESLENCQVLQQLYLAGNQIASLASLPELPNLEFLSVAQNKLKSLSMASQPRLQVLAASKNKISTLKGFPHLPALEHLRVEENPILQTAHLEAASILLVGPTLRKFNDRDLSEEELVLSKSYPAHTALCIRGGWDFCGPEHAKESTFRFLIEQWKGHFPPGYLLEEALIDQPFEEDPCHCHFVFVQDCTPSGDLNLALRYQWFVGERTATYFTVISDATGEVYWPKSEDVGKILKVECTSILGSTEYPPIFAISSPVSPGTGFPKVVSLDVRGDLVEGNIIRGYAEVAWCGGTPGKGVTSWLRRKWNSNPVVIAGAEDEEYKLTNDDIEARLVFMYSPVTEEGAKGEPHYKYTEFVKAAPPSVKNVRIIGDAVEGNTIKGVGDYFGGREGPSKLQWLRENKDTGGFVLVCTDAAEYTLTIKDVSLRLAFVYIPLNIEGQQGDSSSIVSPVIKKAPPRVTNVKIIGDLRENSKVTVSGIVTGGSEASSRVQWFKTFSSTLNGGDGLETVSTAKIAKAFRIPLGAVGCYIVSKFTPMTPDGDSGEPVYAISKRAVESLPPNLNFLAITGDYAEDGILTASYGYIGGHEGRSFYNWYLHVAEIDMGTMIPEAAGLLQYRITKDAIGKFISFKCTPVRDDEIMGEPRTFMGQERVRAGTPRLNFLQIVGTAVEGTTLYIDKEYWGGEEGDSIFRWFRTHSDCTQSEIKGATTASYDISIDDIGFFIFTLCEPVRSDGTHGSIVISEQIGPVIPGLPTCPSLEILGPTIEGMRLSFLASYSGGESGNCSHEWFRVSNIGAKEKLSDNEFLDLSLEEVGSCIELVYIPKRKDGLEGSPSAVVSDLISPADPIGLELRIPDCCEDEEVVPDKRYFGGQEGAGVYIWYRLMDKLHGLALLDISNAGEDLIVCGKTLTYTPTLDDVGAYLALYWLPARVDGKCGKPLVTTCNSPVAAALPVAFNVVVKELSHGVYMGDGSYFGGHEGPSLFSWYRKTNKGTVIPISGANEKTYEVTDPDYNHHLLFGYTPVRSDSVAGVLIMSEPTNIIYPECLEVEMLALTGKAVEGGVLTAVEVIPNSETQQLVWEKYKKNVKYQWFCSVMDDERSFEPLPLQCSCTYRVKLEDIGRCLRCECVVVDVFERSSGPVFAETAPVLPGIPRIDKLEIEGRGFHTNLYAVRGNYSGGKEGKSRIQWLRSMVGSPDLISIPGEIGRMYEANVDDVGYRLVAIYTPVRDDGIEGQPVSSSTEPIAVEPDVLKEVKARVDLGSIKFEVLYEKDRSPKKAAGGGGLERRILEVGRRKIKVIKPGSKTSFQATEMRGTYAPPFHVEAVGNDQHRLRIVVDGRNEAELMVQTRHQRDVIVLVIRGLAQRFNSTSLNSLLKMDP